MVLGRERRAKVCQTDGRWVVQEAARIEETRRRAMLVENRDVAGWSTIHLTD
jgi:hypothetical protein